jgi:protein O-GlcNAc transferase
MLDHRDLKEPLSLASAKVFQSTRLFTREAILRGLSSGEPSVGGLSMEGTARLGRRIGKGFNAELATFEAKCGPRACREGCDHCCHQMVFVTPPEVAQIWEVIKKWPEEQRADLLRRMPVENKELSQHRTERFKRFRGACPFLVDHRCQIYDQRPFVCRSTVAIDAAICRDFRADITAAPPFSPYGAAEISDAIREGVYQSYAESGEAALFELPTILAKLLTDPSKVDEFAAHPKQFEAPLERSWDLVLDSIKGGKEATISLTPVQQDAIANRSNHEIGRFLRAFPLRTAFDGMARITTPYVYCTNAEMDEWRSRWNESIEQAISERIWNPAEAYKALGFFRSGMGYQTMDMRPTMERLGTLLHEKIAVPLAPDLVEPLGPRLPGRVRVGFIGSIGNNSGSKWALGWVQKLNRSEIEVSVLNVGRSQDAASGVSYQFKDVADRYLRLSGDPLAMARFVRSLDLDYLIYCDLGDINGLSQFGIFQLARVQAAAWGCPYTTGLPTIQHYLSSEWVEPEGAEAHYTEQLIRLPGLGLYLEPPPENNLKLDREYFGFPSGFLAGYLQVPHKWLPNRDAFLARIYERTKNPIILVDASGPFVRSAMDKRFADLQIPVQWIPRTIMPVFQRVISSCDVCFDGLDWSGGLTAMQSLEAGVPFPALPGPYARQRLAMGTLKQVGGELLIARDAEDYLDLVTSPDRLREAMGQVNMAQLYRDERPVRALEDLVLKAI